MPDRAVTRDIAVQLLKILNIDPSNVDTLQKIPFQILSDAGKKALQAEASKMRAEGKTITGFGLGWAPSLDGEDFPYQISSREMRSRRLTKSLRWWAAHRFICIFLHGNHQS